MGLFNWIKLDNIELPRPEAQGFEYQTKSYTYEHGLTVELSKDGINIDYPYPISIYTAENGWWYEFVFIYENGQLKEIIDKSYKLPPKEEKSHE